MRRATAGRLYFLLLLAWAAALAQEPGADPLLRAMHQELNRSRTLNVVSLEPPYFIEYSLDDGDSFSLAASMGGLVSRREIRFRVPQVRVRVGDYRFDNTNYVGSAYPFGPRYDIERFPLENIPQVIRRYWWLATDSAYKSALEAISRKRAALKNVAAAEQIADFSRAEPVRIIRSPRHSTLDREAWAERLRKLSVVLAAVPELKNSSADFEAVESTHYLVNSEGTEARVPETLVVLRLRATAQARDGMTLRDAAVIHSPDLDHLSSEAALEASAREVGRNLAGLAHAPMGEDYSGPVLFEGTAAAQIFAEVLGRNFALTRRPVMEPGRPGSFPYSELEGRQGARILPEWMDVVDDPTQKEWRGRPLFGSYEIDREGVAPKPVVLVERGVLKNFLLTRQPVRGFAGSNGRARLPGNFGASAAAISNLFVRAAENAPLADLKRKLIETCTARGKPFGMLIRKMDFPSSATFQEVRTLLAGAGGRNASMPVLVYRVYPDGREELVRGLRFRGLNARSFKDIVAAGDDTNVFEYLENGAPFALIGAGNYVAETCVVAPSVLIDDLELHPLEEELPKLPIVPPPPVRIAANARN